VSPSAGAGHARPWLRTVQVSAQRLLPPGWRGSGRRAVWRRARLRRGLAAALVGLAAWLVAGAVLPEPTPVGVPVLVAARELPPGHRMTASDLRVQRWPEPIRPASALHEPGAAIGATLTSGLGAGEAVTTSRLRGSGLLAGLPAGMVAAHVPLTDPGAAALAHAGDHVDLISSPSGTVLGQDVIVLAVDAPEGAGSSALVGGGETPRPGIVVALTSETAARLATVTGSDLAGSSITLALRRS
jgi:pilus assembly protein CpaB